MHRIITCILADIIDLLVRYRPLSSVSVCACVCACVYICVCVCVSVSVCVCVCAIITIGVLGWGYICFIRIKLQK